VTDQEVDEVCEMIIPPTEPPTVTPPPPVCFKRDCQTVNTTRLVKECQPIINQECDAVIEDFSEEKCKDVTTTTIEKDCFDKVEEQCRQDFEYVCEEKVTTTTPKPHYASYQQQPTYGGYLPPPATQVPYASFQASSKILPPVRNAKYGQKLRVKREAIWPNHPGIDNPFHNLAGTCCGQLFMFHTSKFPAFNYLVLNC
jgi:hypothetical protein